MPSNHHLLPVALVVTGSLRSVPLGRSPLLRVASGARPGRLTRRGRLLSLPVTLLAISLGV